MEMSGSNQDYRLIEKFRCGLSHDAVEQYLVDDGHTVYDDFEISTVMVAVRKIMWRIIGEHCPDYEIGASPTETQADE